MTPEQVALVQATAATVGAQAERFASAFHDRLFTSAPEVRALFGDDLARQGRGLVAALLFLVDAVSELPVFVETTRQLGARHHGYGVRPTHYTVVEEALLGAVAAVLGQEATPSTMLAWQRLYRLIAETMLEGAASAEIVGPTT